MKTKALRLLSALGLILAAVASLDLTGFLSVLPPDMSGKVLAVGLLLGAAKELVFAIGDIADDGKRNNSWVPLLLMALVPLCLLALPSCSVRLGADGSKEATLDGQGAATAIMAAGKIIVEK